MAKRKGPNTKTLSKNQLAKQVHVEKLKAASKAASLSGNEFQSEFPIVRLPPHISIPLPKSKKRPPEAYPYTAGTKLPPSISTVRRPSPKRIKPDRSPEKSIGDNVYGKILDVRHLAPDIPLIHLPHEPDIPRRLYNYVRTGVFPFMELPAELRNQVYDYVIPRKHYHISWLFQKTRSLTYGHFRPKYKGGPSNPEELIERRRDMCIYSSPGRAAAMKNIYDTPTPVSLVWVSKKIYLEASSMFYSKSAFRFDQLQTLRHFLDSLTPANKAAITSLSLKYTAYGHPLKTENQFCKQKHDRAWEKLCWRISTECTSLKALKLDLFLNKSPTTFAPFSQALVYGWGTKWMLPLWAFQDIGITRCLCRLHVPGKEADLLKEESRNVRKEILGEFWDEVVEAGRDAFGISLDAKPKRVKPAPILRLVGDNMVAAH